MNDVDGLCVLQAKELVEIMRGLRPDRGNAFAPRSAQAKGQARYEQWRETVEALGRRMHTEARGHFDPIAFVAACVEGR